MKYKGVVNRQFRYLSSSYMNWNSVPGFHLSVAAALTVGGLILALKELKIVNGSSLAWLSGRGGIGGGSDRLCIVPGLQNLGNNCFLNVVLQALSSCSGFQDYLNYIIEEYEISPAGDVRLMLPLTTAVTDLMEELNTTSDRKVVLSPRQVMYAMQAYDTNFSLSVQQDAAEAFLRLTYSLREEVSDLYVPNNGSLLEAPASPRRIIDPRKLVDGKSEQKRWKELFLGPFDGILGNVLTCQSCSSQIMMDFEFFPILPLVPVTGMGTSIFYGCSLEHCLKQFIASDEVEGYKCDRCWHIAALKYLSAANGNETDIVRLKHCGGQEKCNCKFIPGLESLSVPISRAFKQLNIARCPEILCIQLLRARTDLLGDPIKLEGHISFPLTLNLSPFLRSGIEMEHMGTASRQSASDLGQLVHPLRSMNRQIETGPLSYLYFPHQKKQHSETTMNKQLVLNHDQGNKEDMHATYENEKQSSQCEDNPPSRPEPEINLQQYRQKVCSTETSSLEPRVPTIPMYRLVSVVEHMGNTGGGHYTVYRRLGSKSSEDPEHDQWFLISDSNVIHVTEKEVLSAQAMILFYERITES